MQWNSILSNIWFLHVFQGNTIFVKGIGLAEKILQESFTKFGKVERVNFEKEKR